MFQMYGVLAWDSTALQENNYRALVHFQESSHLTEKPIHSDKPKVNSKQYTWIIINSGLPI